MSVQVGKDYGTVVGGPHVPLNQMSPHHMWS